MVELGLDENSLYVSNKSQDHYNPGRSGSINLKSENGPILAFFGEIHPAILSTLDLKEQIVSGFEIFLKNMPEPIKKYRFTKKDYSISEFQKSERDFAFIIDNEFKAGDNVSIIESKPISKLKKWKVLSNKGDNT